MRQVRLVVSGFDADGLVLELCAVAPEDVDIVTLHDAAPAPDDVAAEHPDLIVLRTPEEGAAQETLDDLAARLPTTRIVVVHGSADIPRDLLKRAEAVFAATLSPARAAAEISRVLTFAAKRATATALPHDLSSATLARQLVRRAAAAWGIGDEDTLALLATELVANAVRHAGSVEVTVFLTDGDIRVEVRDGSKQTPKIGQLISDRESGRGLALVDALAADWGVDPEDDGKCVWFTVPVGARAR
ncbi:MAG TPA: ATP-binding protein [Acidimicrobiales bacterium]|jgi:anti-sigma regulatory factor (Ser/Thr protein kinase)|nr:ATP-binding protein [Acidimicrobiales bacterium]